MPVHGAVPIIKQYPFTAERKMMSTLVPLDPTNPATGPIRLYVTGKRTVSLLLCKKLCRPKSILLLSILFTSLLSSELRHDSLFRVAIT